MPTVIVEVPDDDLDLAFYVQERNGLATIDSVLRFALRRTARELKAEDTAPSADGSGGEVGRDDGD